MNRMERRRLAKLRQRKTLRSVIRWWKLDGYRVKPLDGGGVSVERIKEAMEECFRSCKRL